MNKKHALLIAIEGVDGSGKQTAANHLKKIYEMSGKRVRIVSFPNYDSPSGQLVKDYLSGAHGSDLNSLDSYQASTIFAMDRLVSFNLDWKKDYEDPDCVIILDRYVGSNLYHQSAKIMSAPEDYPFVSDGSKILANSFILWALDFEHNTLKLPKADKTIFLDIPDDVRAERFKKRGNKVSGTEELDLHERDSQYMSRCAIVGRSLANRLSWVLVDSTRLTPDILKTAVCLHRGV